MWEKIKVLINKLKNVKGTVLKYLIDHKKNAVVVLVIAVVVYIKPDKMPDIITYIFSLF